MDADVLAERILLDLKNTFKKDPLIDEFDILPVSYSMYNKCPVIHVEHKVALESWCVQHVYLYAYSKFIKWRQHPYKIEMPVLLSITNAILLINPDLETAWNARKELIQSGQHSAKDELRFSAVVLSRKPKSPQVFSHRKWVLMWLVKNSSSLCALKEMIQNEIQLCVLTANKYSSNYYSWNHRMWIVEHLLHFCPKVVEEELQTTENWVSTHVSDHSGFHYRQFLISCRFLQHSNKEIPTKFCLLHTRSSDNGSPRCFADNCTTDGNSIGDAPNDKNGLLYSLLTKELSLLSDLQFAFQGHETLWNHRRFITYKISHLPDRAKSLYCSSNLNYTVRTRPVDTTGHKKHKLESRFCAVEDWTPLREESFLHRCFQNAKNNEWERKLVLRHITWLNKTALCPVSLP